MIKAVAFDLNGVFIISPKLSDRYFEQFQVPSDKFLPALKDVMAKARLPGAVDIYELWKPYVDSWGLNLSREDFLEFWFKAEGGNEQMVELARQLKERGLRLFVLSNNFKERAEYYAKTFPFLTELFERIYYSWQTGFIKPDRRAYELVLSDNSLAPEEVVYFDDSETNVQVASSLGIHSFIFEGVEQTQEQISRLSA